MVEEAIEVVASSKESTNDVDVDIATTTDLGIGTSIATSAGPLNQTQTTRVENVNEVIMCPNIILVIVIYYI